VVREALTVEILSTLEPRDAAAHFVARRAEGLTAGEQKLLVDWLAKDDIHRRMFDSADRAWQNFADTGSDEILAAMRAHALAPRPKSLARWWPAAAAAAVLIVVAAQVFFTRAPQSTATIQYASARGEVKELQLPDGSSMTLDADSAVVGHFSANGREIQLQRGRALFAVLHDEARPFAVTAAGRRVVAVGTRFDVNLAAEGLTVALLEGKVKIESMDSSTAPVMLVPGQRYVERLGKATILTLDQNPVAWRTGLINFDDQSLAEAAAIMNRYSQEQIVIRDPEVASIRLSGQFRAGETQRFAQTLTEMHQLRAVRRGDQIELGR
jgi:transmembrane sensor